MSCSSLSKSSMRRFQKRSYRFCQPEEVSQNIGKACYRMCAKYKLLSSECKKWEVDIKDLTKPEDFNEFLNGDFRLVAADRIRPQ